jgi:uncharacterized protein (DUF2235 family)
MAKRIILCFDGTWNTPAEKFAGLRALHARFETLGARGDEALRRALEAIDPGPDAVETNVCRLYRSIRRLAPGEIAPDSMGQIKWYDAGVGTSWYDRLAGGTLGLGLSRNIREGYHFLAKHWEPGDEVYVFGFSRGAYTARSLVGMIRNCWLLPPGAIDGGPHDGTVLDAYELYRTRDDSADSQHARAFRKQHGARSIHVKFLGVWDTVGALGIPVQSFDAFNRARYEFHDTELSAIVQNAYHAIAVDEHRKPYAPTLWDPKAKPSQTLEQRWFIGAHCDVGGGYEDRRLSDVTLAWMQAKAQGCGLVLHPEGVPRPRPEDAQAGIVADSFGAFLGGLFQLFQERHFRPVGTVPFGQEAVHPTVFERMRHDPGYRPGNKGLRDFETIADGVA